VYYEGKSDNDKDTVKEKESSMDDNDNDKDKDKDSNINKSSNNNGNANTKSFIIEDEMVHQEKLESNILNSLVNKKLNGKVVNIINNS